jgi:hypothetical protein
MNANASSEECFKTVISYSGKLRDDTYLIPYAMLEYGLLLMDKGETKAAMVQLDKAK